MPPKVVKYHLYILKNALTESSNAFLPFEERAAATVKRGRAWARTHSEAAEGKRPGASRIGRLAAVTGQEELWALPTKVVPRDLFPSFDLSKDGIFCWLRKPPAMPVEVSRKKALASSIERSESRITIKQIRMPSIKTADARLRAAGHLMQVKNHSVHL